MKLTKLPTKIYKLCGMVEIDRYTESYREVYFLDKKDMLKSINSSRTCPEISKRLKEFLETGKLDGRVKR